MQDSIVWWTVQQSHLAARFVFLYLAGSFGSMMYSLEETRGGYSHWI